MRSLGAHDSSILLCVLPVYAVIPLVRLFPISFATLGHHRLFHYGVRGSSATWTVAYLIRRPTMPS